MSMSPLSCQVSRKAEPAGSPCFGSCTTLRECTNLIAVPRVRIAEGTSMPAEANVPWQKQMPFDGEGTRLITLEIDSTSYTIWVRARVGVMVRVGIRAKGLDVVHDLG